MPTLRRLGLTLLGAAALYAQPSYPPPNDLPNPYKTVTGWAQLPDGRKWGSTAGVDVGPDGHIWTYDRCGANSCADSPLDPILEFDASGKTCGISARDCSFSRTDSLSTKTATSG